MPPTTGPSGGHTLPGQEVLTGAGEVRPTRCGDRGREIEADAARLADWKAVHPGLGHLDHSHGATGVGFGPDLAP